MRGKIVNKGRQGRPGGGGVSVILVGRFTLSFCNKILVILFQQGDWMNPPFHLQPHTYCKVLDIGFDVGLNLIGSCFSSGYLTNSLFVVNVESECLL